LNSIEQPAIASIGAPERLVAVADLAEEQTNQYFDAIPPTTVAGVAVTVLAEAPTEGVPVIEAGTGTLSSKVMAPKVFPPPQLIGVPPGV
jgi:hypothetical protein